MIADGRYSIVYPTGDYRIVRIETVPEDKPLAGKVILSLPEDRDDVERKWRGVAFLVEAANESGIHCQFWRSFRLDNSVERQRRIQTAVGRLAHDPRQAGLAFAEKEKRCCKCGRAVSTPASLINGMGAECANVGRWTRKDQVAAYQAGLEQKKEVA